MTHDFEYDAANRVLLCRLHGRVTDESMRGLYREIEKRSANVDARAGILDLSGVTAFDASSATVITLARQDPAMAGISKQRVMVAPSPESFGMSRMFQMAGETKRPYLSVVRTLEEAYALLGMQDARFVPLERSATD